MQGLYSKVDMLRPSVPITADNAAIQKVSQPDDKQRHHTGVACEWSGVDPVRQCILSVCPYVCLMCVQSLRESWDAIIAFEKDNPMQLAVSAVSALHFPPI